MLKRFSLYGFLKNQQYYDYFILLAFRQMGLSYFTIGILIAFREVMINIMEIPTGGIADLCGRRRSMIFSFIAYIISFSVFGFAGTAAAGGGLPGGVLIPLLMAAMVFFAVGEAFRTGTHKALIFGWLRLNGRESERTRVYGYTRSWSKIGSALSVAIACVIVYISSDFITVFFYAIIPYLLNIINFLGYPEEIDCEITENVSFSRVIGHLRETLALSLRQASLRRLLLESMGFEGFFKAAKDYLQPILMTAALPLAGMMFAGLGLSDEQKSIVLIGPVFFVLFLVSAAASRNAYRLVSAPGGEDQTSRLLWGVSVGVFSILMPAIYFQVHWTMIAGFVVLYTIQNLWRPVLISRFDAHSDESKGATVLSIESQAKSLSTMVIAPLLGLAVDLARIHHVGASEFWPVGVMGFLIALAFFLTGKGQQGATFASTHPNRLDPLNPSNPQEQP